jgi:hypothetical protein
MFVETIGRVALSRVFDETNLVEVRFDAGKYIDLVNEIQIPALQIHIPLISQIVPVWLGLSRKSVLRSTRLEVEVG